MGVPREPFALDRGLRVRMVLALVVNGVLIAAAVGMLAWLVVFVDSESAYVLLFIALFAAVGASTAARRARRARAASEADRARLETSIVRLVVLADIPPPVAHVQSDVVPLSWTHSTLWHRPQIYVTTALLDALSDRDLDAVVAHEIAHIQNRDAVVMTLLSAPSTWILRGTRRMWEMRREDWRLGPSLIMFAWTWVPFAAILAVMTYVVSRHRELAADRGAALLIGSPARVATVLSRLAGDIRSIPTRDLRLAGTTDTLHLLPARKHEQRGISRLWATHPSLATRLEQLERLESELQRLGGNSA